jgi:hypothetical protein
LSEQLCHCGRPLHYSDPEIQAAVERLIERLGERVKVRALGCCWLVPRHYIALHGIRSGDLPWLGFEEVED